MRRHRRAALSAMLAGTLLVAAACGDDSDDDAPPPGATTAPMDDDMDDAGDMDDESMDDDEPMDDMDEADDMSDEEPMDDDMSDDGMDDESMDDMSDGDMGDTDDEEPMDDDMSGDGMNEESMDDDMVDLAAWQTMEITDVGGATFTLADYTGTPVLVETFATWCPKCRDQLGDTQAAAAELGDGAAVIALSVETDLSSSNVASYQSDNGFDDIRFAVMSPELLAALAGEFGNTVANAPSTPKFVIDPMGHVGDLSTGSESADDLVDTLRAAAG